MTPCVRYIPEFHWDLLLYSKTYNLNKPCAFRKLTQEVTKVWCRKNLWLSSWVLGSNVNAYLLEISIQFLESHASNNLKNKKINTSDGFCFNLGNKGTESGHFLNLIIIIIIYFTQSDQSFSFLPTLLPVPITTSPLFAPIHTSFFCFGKG